MAEQKTKRFPDSIQLRLKASTYWVLVKKAADMGLRPGEYVDLLIGNQAEQPSKSVRERK